MAKVRQPSAAASTRRFLAQLRRARFDEAGGPIYRQLADAISGAIDGARLDPRHRLPPERELALGVGVSRDTLRQALLELQRHGRVERTVGRSGGTFVAEPKVNRQLSRYAGLAAQLDEQRIPSSARVLMARERPASPAIAAALEIRSGEPVYEIRRVRLANSRPVALERTHYPVTRLPGLLERPLDGSLDALLRADYGVAAATAVEHLEPIAAGPEEVEALGVATGAPLMYVERISYEADGRPLEYGQDVYRGDRTRMIVVGAASAIKR